MTVRREDYQPIAETLDGRVLLSAAGGHAVALTGRVDLAGPAQLFVTPTGQTVVTAATVRGTGDLGLGTPVAVEAHFAGGVAATTRRLVVSTDRGDIVIRTQLYLSDSAPRRFEIVGGTGAYAHATGAGTVTETNAPAPPNATVTLTFGHARR